MCGIAAVVGQQPHREQLKAMVASQQHRGPDGDGVYWCPSGIVGLGHNRLSILDLSSNGAQPMLSHDGRYAIVFNGEIYNYLELRQELADYPYAGASDTEVLLAAFDRWGAGCLDRLIGMFAFAIWDTLSQILFVARDRFGVKPLYYHQTSTGDLLLASEIKALHAAGVPPQTSPAAWSTYLVHGLYDGGPRTFWQEIFALPAGHMLRWEQGAVTVQRWYDLAKHTGQALDQRSVAAVSDEYLALLLDSVRLRFRADVPVGINLSGGLDSSLLLALVQKLQGPESRVHAFTFITGDPTYDELLWVQAMLETTRHPSVVCRLDAAMVPDLAASVQAFQDEPFGGLPTLAYARVFEEARQRGITVLLDGQGLDEQWAGYDYYQAALEQRPAALVQGSQDRALRPECLTDEFAALADRPVLPYPFDDPLRDTQYRDAILTKLPRALRFNDRVSMRAGTELREPFLDQRLFELALRQPSDRKIRAGIHKWLPRQLVVGLVPGGVAEAPKRPLQTPQREWLRGPLQQWADDLIETALTHHGSAWLHSERVRATWQQFCRGHSDNSFYIWQWISLGLLVQQERYT